MCRHVDLDLADVADRAFRHTHFGLLQLVAGVGDDIGDVGGPIEPTPAFGAGLGSHGHQRVGELVAAG